MILMNNDCDLDPLLICHGKVTILCLVQYFLKKSVLYKEPAEEHQYCYHDTFFLLYRLYYENIR